MMATKRTKQVRRGRVLTCVKGYEFKQIGRNRIALVRNNQDVVTLSCACSSTGGCTAVKSPDHPQTIVCLESGCTGTCGWIITIPGIRGLSLTL
jgi:hypothetical protein